MSIDTHFSINSCLHECIEKCAKGLSDEAVKVISVHEKDGTKIHCQFLLSYYIGGLHERGDMCNVNPNGNKNTPCNRCQI